MDTTIYLPELCGNETEYDALWSGQLSLNTSNPDLPLCFQYTALSWMAPLVLILGLIPYVYFTGRNPTLHWYRHLSKLCIAKTLLCVAMEICLLLCILWILGNSPPPGQYLSLIIKIIAYFILSVLTPWSFVKGEHSPGTLFMFVILSVICEIITLRSLIIRHNDPDISVNNQYYLTYIIYCVFLFLEFILCCFADYSALSSQRGYRDYMRLTETSSLLHAKNNLKGSETIVKTEKTMPDRIVPFWLKATFMWFTKTVIRGYKNPLQFDDLYDLPEDEKCNDLLAQHEKDYYTDEGQELLRKSGEPRKHRSILWSLIRTIGGQQAFGSLMRLIAIPVSFLNPQLLNLLINYVASDDTYMWKGLLLSFTMLITNFCFSLLINNFLFHVFRAGARARSIVNAVIYRKALKISSAARRSTTVGQVVNLLSVDAQKVQDFFLYISLLWSVPILIALAIYFMWQQVGPSCLAGLAVLLILIPLNAFYFARKAMMLQKAQMVQKDERFKVMNEILAGMKVIKLYAWEPPFQDQVLGYRDKELYTIRMANYINAFGSMCWLLSPYLVSLATFAAYVLSGHPLDPNKAFVTLSLINLLNWPMSLLPLGVANTVQGLVSMRRIDRFLNLPEMDNDSVEKDPTMTDAALKVENGSFSWNEDQNPVLKDLNFSIPHGSLVAVVGQVGSGKSSLISTLMGETIKRSGRIRINGTIAYVPQQAWIQNAKLKDNILFGKDNIPEKYRAVVDVCALGPDLQMLPGGDQTEIGEKGINVSGGQKQRISLARAVYQDEDIYLLDDPLSAVDSHVGKHIFEKVIGPNGYLVGKTRILVTHAVTYLPFVDLICVLNGETISEIGGYDELMEKGGHFADFIHNYADRPDSADSTSSGDGSEELTYTMTTQISESGQQMESRVPMRKKSSVVKRGISRKKSSVAKMIAKDAVEKGESKLIAEEISEQGNIRLSVLKSYIKAGSFFMLGIVGSSHLFLMVSQILTSIWLSAWSNDDPYVNGTYDKDQVDFRLGIYGGLGAAQAIFALSEAFAVAYGCYKASRGLHENLLLSIMRAPMAFFDTTPLGRIMNRFSKDMDVLDANMPQYIRQWLFAVSPVITTMILICYSTPIFLVIVVPISILFVVAQRLFIATQRQLKRIDAVRRSPIYTHFDESIVGASSIRAYRREQEFIDKMDSYIDNSQKPWYLIMCAQRWCGVAMEFLGAGIVFFASLFAAVQKSTISAGVAGLSVSYSQQVTLYMNALIRNSSELETYVVSVERVDEYASIDSEASWREEAKQPPADWPSMGKIAFENYGVRYRPGLDLVLKNIDCSINPQEKIGIVGRTGAGKSSLSLALFRIIEAAVGAIRIDGHVIADMGLHDLRSKVSIIPQDPVVFSGTLRKNLDPFYSYADSDIWKALTHAHLKDFVSGLSEGLEYECGEGGEALSVGQRQLLCLARALLRDSKILVLDEATAAVDLETDALIQNTIRTQFSDCTILTVAHRLNTVMDYDRIMVLSSGRVVEFDKPHKLLHNKKSVFYGMAQDAGLI